MLRRALMAERYARRPKRLAAPPVRYFKGGLLPGQRVRWRKVPLVGARRACFDGMPRHAKLWTCALLDRARISICNETLPVRLGWKCKRAGRASTMP